MKVSEIKIIQTFLQEETLYAGKIDGKKGPKTTLAVNTALSIRSNALPDTWEAWSESKKTVAYLQLICQENGIDVGMIDGLYGPQTESASGRLKQFLKTGELSRGFGDITPIRANPHLFPTENYEDLLNYYGLPCEAPLVQVPCPWELQLDWDLGTKTHTISIHEKLAESLSMVLENVFTHYGPEGIKQYGLNRYGGSYNCRKKRNSLSAWSTHAWGISIDWFPSKNKLHWNSNQASLAHPDLDAWWEFWEREGWLSLGRSEDRDWMHIQAAKR